MNVGIDTIHVTHRDLQTVRAFLQQDDPVWRSLAQLRDGHRKTEFEWHVESRNRDAVGPRYLYPTQVMDGEKARLDEIDQSVAADSPLAGDFENATGALPYAHKRSNQRDEERFVPDIEWDIQEDAGVPWCRRTTFWQVTVPTSCSASGSPGA
jgi:hypothetical protein